MGGLVNAANWEIIGAVCFERIIIFHGSHNLLIGDVNADNDQVDTSFFNTQASESKKSAQVFLTSIYMLICFLRNGGVHIVAAGEEQEMIQ